MPSGHPLEIANLAAILTAAFPNRGQSSEEDYEDLLSDYHHFGVMTAESLREIIVAKKELVLKKEAQMYERTVRARGYYFFPVGIGRALLAQHVGEETYNEYEMAQFAAPPKPRLPSRKEKITVLPPGTPTVRSTMKSRFEEITGDFVKGFFNGRPEIEKTHGDSLRKYLNASMSYEEFEKQMVEADRKFAGNRSRPIDLDAALTDDGSGTQQVFLATASQMTVLGVFGRLSVYQHRFITPTELQTRLFSHEDDYERQVFISAITGEVPVSEFLARNRREKGDLEGSKIYHFRTPEFTWEQLFGREGYLIVRDEKIVEVAITTLN